MKLEREIKNHKIIITQDSDIINGAFILEVYPKDSSKPEYAGKIGFSTAYTIWKKWGMRPQELLLEEAESYITDKKRSQEISSWIKRT